MAVEVLTSFSMRVHPMQTHSNLDSQMAKSSAMRRGIFCGIGLAVSAAFMAAASRGDLSLDEVISLETALGSQNWLAIFMQNADDNNHLLNTFFLHLLGGQHNLFIYRIPAVLFGIYTIVALMWSARRYDKEAAVWVVYLAGLSYPIILYASEARGYAPAMFFAVVSFEMLQRYWERKTRAGLILFWTSLCFGFLSHFSFVIIVVALGGWAVIREKYAGTCFRVAMGNLAKLYAVPALFLASVYLFFIRHMIILGGPVFSRWQVVGSAACHALGLMDTGGLPLVSVLSAVILAGFGVWNLFRQGRFEWIFFVLVLFAAPVLVVTVLHPKYLYFRYFMVCFPFFYLLLAFLFAQWFRNSGMIKIIPVLLILTITMGHSVKLVTLLNFGRGNYRRALNDMAAATPGQFIKIGSDSDFKNGNMLNFYGLFLPPSKKIKYILFTKIPLEKPDWFVVSIPPTANPTIEVDGVIKCKYNLFSIYPFCGLSGMNWFVYRLSAETETNSNRTPVMSKKILGNIKDNASTNAPPPV
jgi:hypothetical protein